MAPLKKQRRKDHHSVDRQVLEIVHQGDGFIGRLRRDRGDVHLARVVHGLAGDFINARLFFQAEHRALTDAGAGYQAGNGLNATDSAFVEQQLKWLLAQ